MYNPQDNAEIEVMILMRNVGILGSGDVAKALGRGFASKGYNVKIGSRTRNSEKLKEWRKEAGSTSSTGNFEETAKFGEILVIAALGAAVDEVINLAGPINFNGKLVIDTTNPLDFSKGMPPGNFLGLDDSLGERIQRKLPQAKVVKCFNTVPNSVMFNPPDKTAEMLICGNDTNAKNQVGQILKQFGWKGAIDIGGIAEARWLEAFVPLWVRTAVSVNSWNTMFKVVH
jgi:predicted dinucleotide-binding enzyme